MMGFFKGKSKPAEVDLSTLTNSDDRRILGLLAAQGDPLFPARHTRFYFQTRNGADEGATEAFARLADEALEMGFRVGEQREGLLVLEIDQSMHVEVVNAARRLMEHWADIHVLEFDGWECQVARSVSKSAH